MASGVPPSSRHIRRKYSQSGMWFPVATLLLLMPGCRPQCELVSAGLPLWLPGAGCVQTPGEGLHVTCGGGLHLRLHVIHSLSEHTVCAALRGLRTPDCDITLDGSVANAWVHVGRPCDSTWTPGCPVELHLLNSDPDVTFLRGPPSPPSQWRDLIHRLLNTSVRELRITMATDDGNEGGDFPWPPLRALTMTCGRLRGLPPGSAAGLQHLTLLDLSDNQLTGVPRNISNFKILENLVLKKLLRPETSTTFLDNSDELASLQALKILDLGQTKFGQISHANFLPKLQYLQALSLQGCALEHITVAHAFSIFPNLEKLDLSGNPLKSLQGLFVTNSNLKIVNLSHIQNDIDDVQLKNQNLQVLDFTATLITKFPNFENCNIENVILKETYVEDIPNASRKNVKIQNLDMSRGRQLRYLTDGAHTFRNFQFQNYSKKFLEFEKSWVNFLNLSYVHRDFFTEENLNFLHFLNALDMGGVQFECANCQNLQISKFLNSNRPIKIFNLNQEKPFWCADVPKYVNDTDGGDCGVGVHRGGAHTHFQNTAISLIFISNILLWNFPH